MRCAQVRSNDVLVHRTVRHEPPVTVCVPQDAHSMAGGRAGGEAPPPAAASEACSCEGGARGVRGSSKWQWQCERAGGCDGAACCAVQAAPVRVLPSCNSVYRDSVLAVDKPAGAAA